MYLKAIYQFNFFNKDLSDPHWRNFWNLDQSEGRFVHCNNCLIRRENHGKNLLFDEITDHRLRTAPL
jgi:hypothetical protein